jgi:hypothetical protein
MKTNLVLLSAAAVFILMSTVAFAGTGIAMNVHVPFDFYAGDRLLQAGDYTFEMGSGNAAIASVVMIRSQQNPAVIMLTIPGRSGSESAQLLFNQYGEKHFLNTVSIRGFEAKLKMFSLEKELSARMQNARNTILVAQK